MSDEVRSHRLGPPLLAVLLTAGPVQAQIVTDGSVGPKVSLSGGEIKIGADLGTRRGDNLFHSFERFGIATGQSATFTGPDTVKNVISRVTGGEVSTIDGTLTSRVGQADLYFLNPAGVMFGPNAQLDVPGSLHVSTAHELHFADGTRFSAVDKAGSGLTVAPPEAFGFLDRPPGRIAVEHSQLSLQPGKAFSLVGGSLDIVDGARLAATSGAMTLAAIASPGQVRISDSTVNADAQGPIRLSNQAELDVSGNGGGAIRIRGGALRLDNSSIFAFNTGERDSTTGIDLQADLIELDNSPVGLAAIGSGRSGAITVRAGTLSMKGPGSAIADNTGAGGDAGTVTVQADRLFSSGSVISSAAASGSTGRGGTVTVTARELELYNGGQIHSGTLGKGDAGRVTVNADHLLVSGFRISGVTEAGYPSGIASSAAIGSTGRAGTVVVTARELTVQNGGQIASNTFGSGNAGTVEVRADHLIASGGTSGFTNIASTAQPGSTGRGGTVAIVAGALELHSGAQIISTTWGPGDAGQITIEADRLLVSGFDPGRGYQYASGIGSSTQPGSTGWGGAVAVTAHDVTVQDGGQIASSTFGSGDAGTVEVRADRLKVSGGNLGFANIASSTSPGSTGRGGAIVVMAGELELWGGAQITSSTQGPGDAGHISIDADRLLVSGAGATNRSTLIASGAPLGSTGAGGSVNIRARTILLQDQGLVTTQSDGTGPGGPLTITATDTLRLDNAAIRARTASAEAGDVMLSAGRLFDLRDSELTTSVAGGTGSGGNIFINPHLMNPPLMVLDNSRIEANAQRGAGGNITIRVGQLIRTPDSKIQASSAQSVSGTITITAPNTDVAGSLIVLPETFFDVSSELRETCAARGGRPASSFTAGGRGGLPPDPGSPLTASSFERPPGQQTATGSPTALTAKPRQAAKPITVAGIPQLVLGSPRLTCRG